MFPTLSQYAQALDELTSGKDRKEQGDIIEKFSAFLRARGEAQKLGGVAEELERLSDEKQGILRVSVLTAHKADGDLEKKLKNEASEHFPGKKVSLDFRVDPDLIGGYIFKTDETLYDASIATELKKLSKTFSN